MGEVSDVAIERRVSLLASGRHITFEQGNGVDRPPGSFHGFTSRSAETGLRHLRTLSHAPVNKAVVQWHTEGLDSSVDDPNVSPWHVGAQARGHDASLFTFDPEAKA